MVKGGWHLDTGLTDRAGEDAEGMPAGPRPRRRLVGVGLVTALAVFAAGAGCLWAEQGRVELSAVSWECTGTQLVAAAGPSDDPLVDPPLAPELVPGMACWGSWRLISLSTAPVLVDSLHLDFGGPATGAAFRIPAARVDGQDVAVRSPDGYAIRMPVSRRLAHRESAEVGVLVEFGEGCTPEDSFFTLWPAVRTTAWSVPRTITHFDDEDEFETVSVARGLTVVGTPASSCENVPDQ